jgi:hypothetical protein
MATWSLDNNYQFKFINHSDTVIHFDIRAISGNDQNYGNIASNIAGPVILAHTFFRSDTLEFGNIAVVAIGNWGAPVQPVPGVRFWSGGFGAFKEQYINLLGENGWTVTKDTSDISEVTGNGFRITVDGGGTFIPISRAPDTQNIFFQVYNA